MTLWVLVAAAVGGIIAAVLVRRGQGLAAMFFVAAYAVAMLATWQMLR